MAFSIPRHIFAIRLSPLSSADFWISSMTGLRGLTIGVFPEPVKSRTCLFKVFRSSCNHNIYVSPKHPSKWTKMKKKIFVSYNTSSIKVCLSADDKPTSAGIMSRRRLCVYGSMPYTSCSRTSSPSCIFFPFIWVSKVVSESVRSLQDQYNLVMLLQCHWNFYGAHQTLWPCRL